RAEEATLEMLASWKAYAIDGWTTGNHPWYYFSEKLGAMMADLIGAKSEEVVATGSTTVNLHQLASTFYQPEGKRSKIDRKSTRLNSSHVSSSYAGFCLKKKKEEREKVDGGARRECGSRERQVTTTRSSACGLSEPCEVIAARGEDAADSPLRSAHPASC